MNGFGGTISNFYPDLGIGTIQPDTGGPEIIFSDNTVQGGDPVFRRMRPGDRVKYLLYPEEIAGQPFAKQIQRS